LAFSIAIRAKSDVLLIDEVLAVGDSLFQKKCYDYFRQLKQDKKTVIFVSHDSDALLKYCDRGLLLEQGKVVTNDKIDRVVNEYMDVLNASEDQKKKAEEKAKTKTRWGTGDARVISATALGEDMKTKADFADEDSTILIKVTYKANKNINEPVYGIIISDEDEHRVFNSNTMINHVKTVELKAGTTTTLQWRIPNVFNSGTFSVAPAIANSDGTTILDWAESSCKFRVRKKVKNGTFINAKHDIVIGVA
ncbi:MAG TPA: Wzt carbohydrate-binding domain-containing protein, partial [Candidatus Limnocylindria bacterium]|nr:Wzt carbohydrate-binding domain-containing protein [Candidatus Limnocylindria bacterium]